MVPSFDLLDGIIDKMRVIVVLVLIQNTVYSLAEL
jgi:hypothetical protein